MMTKVKAAVILLALIMSLTACGPGAAGTAAPSASNFASDAARPALVSYAAYYDSKGVAFEELLTFIGEREEPYTLLSEELNLLGKAEVKLMPLKTLGLGEDTKRLEPLGITDVAATQEQDSDVVTFKRDGSACKITCTYNESAGSLQANASGSSGEECFFEDVKTGSGYVSQYYLNEDATHIMIFFDGSTIAMGMEKSQAKPETMLDGASLTVDFVKNGEMYFILSKGQITIFKNGEDKTFR